MKTILTLLISLLLLNCGSNGQKEDSHKLVITQYASDGKVINSWVSHKLGKVVKDVFCFELDNGKTMCVSSPYSIEYSQKN